MVEGLKRLIMEIAAIAVILLLAWRCAALRGELADEGRRHEANVAAAEGEIRRLRLKDSISCAVIGALELKADEAGRLVKGLRARCEELGARVRDVRAAAAVETVITDTVYFPEAGGLAGDTCVEYSDAWAALTLCGLDSGAPSVSYSVRDSVSTIVYVSYRRRFLWWRWKPEYRAAVMSKNPNTAVTAMEAVVVEE